MGHSHEEQSPGYGGRAVTVLGSWGGGGTRTGYLGDGMTSEMRDVSGHDGRVCRGQDTRASGQGFQQKSRHERDTAA